MQHLKAAVGGRAALVLERGSRRLAEHLHGAGVGVRSCRLDEPRVEELVDRLETATLDELGRGIDGIPERALVVDGSDERVLRALVEDVRLREVLGDHGRDRLVVLGDAAVRRRLEQWPFSFGPAAALSDSGPYCFRLGAVRPHWIGHRPPSAEPRVFAALQLGRDALRCLPERLMQLERTRYERRGLEVHLYLDDAEGPVADAARSWAVSNAKGFAHVRCIVPPAAARSTPDSVLERAVGDMLSSPCESLWWLADDCYVGPEALRELAALRKAAVAPMLDTLPDATEAYSNYFTRVDARGFYERGTDDDHRRYLALRMRDAVGCFAVPVAHGALLIDRSAAELARFRDGSGRPDWIVACEALRAAGVCLSLCNVERCRGYVFHPPPDCPDRAKLYEDEARHRVRSLLC